MKKTRTEQIKAKLQRGEWLTSNELAHISNHLVANPIDLANLTPEQCLNLGNQLTDEPQQRFSPVQQAQKQGLEPAELYRRMVVSGDAVDVPVVNQGNAWGNPHGAVLQTDSALKASGLSSSTIESAEHQKDRVEEQNKLKPATPKPAPAPPIKKQEPALEPIPTTEKKPEFKP